MKKLLLIAIIAVAGFSSCGNNKVTADKYQCPMKCEGEKTYDSAGKCPVCKMDMEKVK
jgi:protein SCO1